MISAGYPALVQSNAAYALANQGDDRHTDPLADNSSNTETDQRILFFANDLASLVTAYHMSV
jgi:hypothetical protein